MNATEKSNIETIAAEIDAAIRGILKAHGLPTTGIGRLYLHGMPLHTTSLWIVNKSDAGPYMTTEAVCGRTEVHFFSHDFPANAGPNDQTF